MKTRLLYLGLVVLSLTLTACGEIPTALPREQDTPTPFSTDTPLPTSSPLPTPTPATQPSGEVLVFIGEGIGETRLYEAQIDAQGLHNLITFQGVVGGPPFGMYPTDSGRYVAIDIGMDTDNAVDLVDVALRDFFSPPVNDGYLGNGRFVSWTPEGDMLYLALGGYGLLPTGLWRINVRQDEGHQHFDIATDPESMGAVTMSPDGTTILYSVALNLGQGSQVWRMAADGSGQTLLWSDSYHYIGGFEYSPDGSQVAYMVLPDSPVPFPSASVWVMDADGSNRRQLSGLADGGHGYRPHWSPDGMRIVFVGKENPTTYEGREVAEGAINNVYIANPDTGAVQALLPLEPGQQHNYDPWWSPDGTQIVFISDRGGADEIWVINADGTNLRQLTNDGVDKRYPLWIYEWTSSLLPLLWKGPQGESARPSAQC